jgi:DNA (cytosine-5)-methyltransferase 1
LTGLLIDNFAGGGGASYALMEAFGRKVDIAINHDAKALAMHKRNHPETLHLQEDVFAVDPYEVCAGRPIDAAWFSPDCTHFSAAKGGKPKSKKIRALAWVVLRWASLPAWQRPRVIFLENVKEFETWGPLDENGKPIKDRMGETFHFWWKSMEKRGYKGEVKKSRASSFGARTIRYRLLIIWRCDGQPIVWPEPTYHDPDKRPPTLRVKTRPHLPVSDVIDWSLPCPSIFGRKKPLAENTLRRVARGVFRYVLENPKPFLVRVTQSSNHAPLSIDNPLPTITAGGAHIYEVAAFLAPYNNNPDGSVNAGHDLRKPISTIASKGPHQAVIAAHLLNLKGSARRDAPADGPCPAICAGGTHVAAVTAFLIKYYRTGGPKPVDLPLDVATSVARFGLVTVMIEGTRYAIVDIGMRMLTPRELFLAQGFPEDYILDVEHEGRKLTKSDLVRLVGNSVSPPWAIAHAVANAPLMSRLERVSA